MAIVHTETDSDSAGVAVKQTSRTLMAYPFWFGGTASSMATLFTHPLDLGQFIPSLPLIISDKSDSKGSLTSDLEPHWSTNSKDNQPYCSK